MSDLEDALDLQDALDAIRGRALDAERGRSDDYVKWSQPDVPRLLAAVEAVLETVECHPVPSKLDDPTGEIMSAIEHFGDAIEATIRDHLNRGR